MKSAILSLVAFFVCLSFANAQSFHAGLKFGTNVNKISGQSFKDEFTYNYHVGAFATIGLGEKWAIQPEVIYNEISADTSNKFSDLYKLSFNRVSGVKLNYLSIPVLLNYNLGKNIALQAGPQFGVLLNKDKNLLENGKSAFNDGDLSLLGGVQIKFSSLRIYGRYGIGLNNLNDIDNKDRWKSQTIQLGIGLSLF